MACLVTGSEIVLTGFVGESLWDDGFHAFEVIQALAAIGHDAEVTLRLNSGGGYATEGAAIHAALTAHGGPVRLTVEGVAASAASVIAMAGTTVTMAPGAVLMIHDPAVGTWGDATEHERSLRGLHALGDSYAAIYAARTGKDTAEMRALMRAETWFTAEQAVEAGLADAVGTAPIGTADDTAPAPTAFDYRAYANAPRRLVALAETHGWRLPTARSPHHKETPVSDPTPATAGAPPAAATLDPAKIAAEAVAADRQRRAAVLALDDATGREALAEHLLSTTDMTAEAIQAALAAAPTANVPQPDTDPDSSPQAYTAERAAASGLALPGSKPKARATLSARDIYTARRKTLKEA